MLYQRTIASRDIHSACYFSPHLNVQVVSFTNLHKLWCIFFVNKQKRNKTNTMVKTFDANPPPLLNLDALPEHFDYLEAVPAGVYYDKGVNITIKVVPLVAAANSSDVTEAIAMSQHMRQMKRQILRTDTCEMEIPELQFSTPGL